MPAQPLTLPFDPDAERNLIASVLVDSDTNRPSLKACAELGLSPACFYEPKHQLIWNAIQAVDTEGAMPDEITVANHLRNQGVIEQAGCGKSTLVTTMAIRWALGFDLWGMKPVKPLRILILQSENDLGDLSEQWTDCCAALNLSASERARLSEQIFIYREAVKTGEAFGQTLEELITRHSCDLAFVDPLLGFAGGDVSKQDFCSHFLRHILQPCLMRTGCALIAVHHQNKPPKKKEEQGSITSTYDFTGSAELANWFRSTAILRREDNELPHFILKLGKRGARAGLQDSQGRFTDSLRIRHSKVRGQICWERNNDPIASQDV